MTDTSTIGQVAGQVWQFLQGEGKSSVSAIERGVDASGREVQMGIGWLAREGKVEFSDEPRGLYVSLSEGT
ncbi:MAG: winged helix-turn-helix domain-containing protein [Anaerolineales bacterium]|nr:winged helix-turn-helix domain-containing protein [Anaerolineales bacterium]